MITQLIVQGGGGSAPMWQYTTIFLCLTLFIIAGCLLAVRCYSLTRREAPDHPEEERVQKQLPPRGDSDYFDGHGDIPDYHHSSGGPPMYAPDYASRYAGSMPRGATTFSDAQGSFEPYPGSREGVHQARQQLPPPTVHTSRSAGERSHQAYRAGPALSPAFLDESLPKPSRLPAPSPESMQPREDTQTRASPCSHQRFTASPLSHRSRPPLPPPASPQPATDLYSLPSSRHSPQLGPSGVPFGNGLTMTPQVRRHIAFAPPNETITPGTPFTHGRAPGNVIAPPRPAVSDGAWAGNFPCTTSMQGRGEILRNSAGRRPLRKRVYV